MDSCVFCKIVNDEIPSSRVFEDENYLAFLSIRPINPGHVLVVPKKHTQHLHQLDDTSYAGLMLRAKKLMIALKESMGYERVGLMVSGWDVPHVHVHVVPLLDEDDVTSRKSIEDTLHNPSREELHDVAEILAKKAVN
jgi:histidine triad (HIT) family protein